MNEIKKVWIKSKSDNLEIVLPVTPFITFKKSMNIVTQDLFGFGEVNNGMTRKLARWACESFFPNINNNYDFDVSHQKYSPSFYEETFDKWYEQKHILHFQYYSTSEVLNDYFCQITDFSHGEKYGTGDVFYTLDFIEYRELKIDQQYVAGKSSKEIIESYGSDTYYVGEGENLVMIAAKLYGDSTKWVNIMDKNGLSNPLDIKVGQALKI